MPAKRPLSPTSGSDDPSAAPGSSSGADSPAISSATLTKKAKLANSLNKTQGSCSQIGTSDGMWLPTAGWTPEKKEAVISKLLAAGLVAIGESKIAEEFAIPKNAVHNALQNGKPGNLRGKVIKSARN